MDPPRGSEQSRYFAMQLNRTSGKTGKISPFETKSAQREVQYTPVYFDADCARRSVDAVHEASESASRDQ